MIEKIKLKNAFLHNRAEEFPDDIWDSFVIPKHFHENNLMCATKARVIEGGRGCGKTMFIRYFCHPTRFSTKREFIDESELKHIGLYWRPHTQTCSLFIKNWLGETSRAAFLHYLSLILTVELIDSIKNIATSSCKVFGYEIFEILVPTYFSRTMPAFKEGQNLKDLRAFCMNELDYIETWINKPTDSLEYNLNPLNSLNSLIRSLVDNYPIFNETVFQVFIDEFENLREEQQRLINDYLKHGKKPLIFSVAMKKYANASTQTSGEEHINDGHDFVKIDLEKSLSEEDFRILAAEVTLLRLHDAQILQLPEDIEPSYFKDPERLNDENYSANTQLFVSKIEDIFPSQSIKTISENIINDQYLNGTVLNHIKTGLKLHNENSFKASDFISSDPRVTIVTSSVLNRKSISPQQVFEEIQKFESGKDNKYEGDSGWIKSTLNGSIYLIYKRFPKRSCPLYAGFNRLCRISQKNLRHYQLLFSQCIAELPDDSLKELTFDCELQARAATNASLTLLSEIVRFGPHGEQLLGFAKRLGFLFELSQKRISQSESEVNHFSLGESDESKLSEESRVILREAKRWSVLHEEVDATKSKSSTEVATSDYVLNPIYAPKFGISYRKNRKITIPPPELEKLINGKAEDWKNVLNKYSIQWQNYDDNDKQWSLF